MGRNSAAAEGGESKLGGRWDSLKRRENKMQKGWGRDGKCKRREKKNRRERNQIHSSADLNWWDEYQHNTGKWLGTAPAQAASVSAKKN